MLGPVCFRPASRLLENGFVARPAGTNWRAAGLGLLALHGTRAAINRESEHVEVCDVDLGISGEASGTLDRRGAAKHGGSGARHIISKTFFGD